MNYPVPATATPAAVPAPATTVQKAKAPTKKEKGKLLDEIMDLLEGRQPSEEMMKLTRWLADHS